MNEDQKADLIKKEAVEVAKDLIDHARETARQMLLGTNLDTSKIPLICNKIVKIEESLVWIRWSVMGIFGGIGVIFIAIVIGAITKH